MKHQLLARPGWRSMVGVQIAVCFFFTLALASVEIQPPSEAGGANVTDGIPNPAAAPPHAGPATPAIVSSQNGLSNPRFVPGQTSLDGYTVALYHFDSPNSIAVDETGNYPGVFNGNASITNLGVYDGSLSLDGANSHVSAGPLPALSQGTLEAFIDFQSACVTASDYYSIITAQDGYGNTVFQLKDAVGLTFGIYTGGQWVWADSGINPCRYLSNGPSASGWPYETWRFHQVAVTWGPRGMEIWVDGVLHGVGTTAIDNPDPITHNYHYKCNPQMQLGTEGWPPNPLYPVCPIPVMAPPYAPGDYTGSIPSVTLNIGCGVDRCFKGRIDEVRVSNVQRTFNFAVVPTITPTPTKTPVRIGGEYAPDSDTIALYHFSQDAWYGVGHFTVDSQTGQWDAALDGNAALTPGGRFNSGMVLDGSLHGIWDKPTQLLMNSAKVPPQVIGAYEAWVNLAPDSPETSPLYVSGGTWDDINFGLYSGHVAFRVYNGSYFVSNETQILKTDIAGSWHHLAATWGERGLEVWLDGTLCNRVGFPGNFPQYIIANATGCDRSGNCTKGIVDEVRLSKVQRTFSPESGQYRRSRSYSEESPPSNPMFLPMLSLAPTPVHVPCPPF